MSQATCARKERRKRYIAKLKQLVGDKGYASSTQLNVHEMMRELIAAMQQGHTTQVIAAMQQGQQAYHAGFLTGRNDAQQAFHEGRNYAKTTRNGLFECYMHCAQSAQQESNESSFYHEGFVTGFGYRATVDTSECGVQTGTSDSLVQSQKLEPRIFSQDGTCANHETSTGIEVAVNAHTWDSPVLLSELEPIIFSQDGACTVQDTTVLLSERDELEASSGTVLASSHIEEAQICDMCCIARAPETVNHVHICVRLCKACYHLDLQAHSGMKIETNWEREQGFPVFDTDSAAGVEAIPLVTKKYCFRRKPGLSQELKTGAFQVSRDLACQMRAFLADSESQCSDYESDSDSMAPPLRKTTTGIDVEASVPTWDFPVLPPEPEAIVLTPDGFASVRATTTVIQKGSCELLPVCPPKTARDELQEAFSEGFRPLSYWHSLRDSGLRHPESGFPSVQEPSNRGAETCQTDEFEASSNTVLASSHSENPYGFSADFGTNAWFAKTGYKVSPGSFPDPVVPSSPFCSDQDPESDRDADHSHMHPPV